MDYKMFAILSASKASNGEDLNMFSVVILVLHRYYQTHRNGRFMTNLGRKA
jgi:hypothetical protein